MGNGKMAKMWAVKKWEMAGSRELQVKMEME